jgi:hypothetical protein
MNKDNVFNDLTDELFGYLAQLGLRRTSAELDSDEGQIDYESAYNGMVHLARHAHSECLKVREEMLSKNGAQDQGEEK